MPQPCEPRRPHRAPPPLRRAALWFTGLLLLTTAGLMGCSDQSAFSGPRIHRVVPPEAPPGALVRIEGEGFGEGGSVALGGRALPASGWGAGAVVVALPADAPSGASLLVVVAGGRASAPHPFEVLGDGARPDYGRRFPDAGPATARDMGPLPTDGEMPRPDLGVDGGETSVVGQFSPDPPADDAVSLAAVDTDRPGFLTLRVLLPRDVGVRVGGVAFHLIYEPGIMQFDGAIEPADLPQLMVRELAPGRLAVGAIEPSAVVVNLRFRLGARGEARVDIPARHSSLRDENNQIIPVRYLGGSVRLVQP